MEFAAFAACERPSEIISKCKALPRTSLTKRKRCEDGSAPVEKNINERQLSTLANANINLSILSVFVIF